MTSPSNYGPMVRRPTYQPLELDPFQTITVELCAIFDQVSRLQLSYARGIIGRGEYRQETRKLYQKARKLMPVWIREGEAKGEL